MKKSNRFAKLLSSIAFVAAALVILPASIANASVTAGIGGGGGSGGPGGMPSTYYWAPISYQQIWAYPAGFRENLDNKICSNAVEIWGLRDSASAGFAAHNYKEIQNRNFPWHGNPSSEVYWAAGPAVNVICRDNPNQPSGETFNAFRVVKDGSQTTAPVLKKTADYSWATIVRPQIVVNGKDPIREDNLNAQASPAIKTEFGKVWDELNTGKGTSGFKGSNAADVYKKKIDAAVAKDAKGDHAKVNLNDKNKAGMAEGGILNVIENTVPATVEITTKAQKWKVQYRPQDRWTLSGWQWRAGSTWKDATGTISNPNSVIWTQALGKKTQANERAKFTSPNGSVKWTAYASSAVLNKATQKNTGFWQIISVICNPEGMKALLASPQAKEMGLTKLSGTEAIGPGVQSDVYRTKKYAQQPANVPLGSPTGGDAATQATAKVNFFTQECTFVCTNAPSNSKVAGDAANNEFELRGDKSIPGAQIFEPAETDFVKNGKSFTAPRDGENRSVRINSWYPVAEQGFTPSDSPAKKTLVSRWTGGTPDLGTMFKMESKSGINGKGTPMFDASRGNADISKIDATTGAGQFNNASVLPGAVNWFNTSGNWASVPDKPQTLRASWLYEGTVTRSAPTGNIGFGVSGSIVDPTVTTHTTVVDGWCTAESKAVGKSDPELVKEMQGSGKITFKENPSNADLTSRLTLQYIRGTGE